VYHVPRPARMEIAEIAKKNHRATRALVRRDLGCMGCIEGQTFPRILFDRFLNSRGKSTCK